MEAALFFINIGLMLVLCRAIRKAEKSTPPTTSLGLFSFREERAERN